EVVKVPRGDPPFTGPGWPDQPSRPKRNLSHFGWVAARIGYPGIAGETNVDGQTEQVHAPIANTRPGPLVLFLEAKRFAQFGRAEIGVGGQAHQRVLGAP